MLSPADQAARERLEARALAHHSPRHRVLQELGLRVLLVRLFLQRNKLHGDVLFPGIMDARSVQDLVMSTPAGRGFHPLARSDLSLGRRARFRVQDSLLQARARTQQ